MSIRASQGKDIMGGTQSSLATITGIGCVSPFGVGGRDVVADVLRTSATAIGPITNFSTDGLSRHLGAEIPPEHLPRTDAVRRWSRMSLMTVTACREALGEAGLYVPGAMHNIGLVLGTAFGDLQSTEAFGREFLRRGPPGLSPLLFPNTVMNAMAATVSIALGLQGPLLTLNDLGAAGEVAVARAVALLQAARVPVVIACGVDELFPLLYAMLADWNVTSPRDAGEEACRPFDQRHNGPVLGEGATAVVLETPEHARARQVLPLAEVYSARWGTLKARPNRYPARRDLESRLLEQALQDASMAPRDVDVAYLSGSGDRCHDTVELELLTLAFGSDVPLLTAITHLTGDYGGLGTFRVAAAALTASGGILPALTYLHRPIHSDMRFATAAGSTSAPGMVLAHGLGRGGTQVAIVLGPRR